MAYPDLTQSDDQIVGSLDAPSYPFTYNTAAWSQRIPVAVLATVGFLISVYLALYQYKLISWAWDPIFGDQTEKVLDSNVSGRMEQWFHVPDAAFGAIAYLGDAIFGMAGSTRRWQYRPWMVLLFGFDVIPLGIVGAILVFMQGAVVKNWCFLCICSAIISLILIKFAYDEVWACLYYLWRLWKETHDAKVLWLTFWGFPTEEGDRVAEQLIRQALEKRRAEV